MRLLPPSSRSQTDYRAPGLPTSRLYPCSTNASTCIHAAGMACFSISASDGRRREVLLTLLASLFRRLLLTLQSEPPGIFYTISISNSKAKHESRALQIRISDSQKNNHKDRHRGVVNNGAILRPHYSKADPSGILVDANMCCKQIGAGIE